MALNRGGSGRLLFRDQDIIGGIGAYFFEVNASGQYKIFIISTVNKELRGWTFSSVIHQGNKAKNTLQVMAFGQSLTIYVNGAYLTRMTNKTFL